MLERLIDGLLDCIFMALFTMAAILVTLIVGL
jgi:hypothetical protein